jgi:hypothetical protein
MSIEEFQKNQGEEVIDIVQQYYYKRPDQRKLPSMLSNVRIDRIRKNNERHDDHLHHIALF